MIRPNRVSGGFLSTVRRIRIWALVSSVAANSAAARTAVCFSHSIGVAERDVALKLLRASNLEDPADPSSAASPSSSALDRFRREFSLLAGIDHPGVARAYDFGFLEACPVLHERVRRR